MTAYRLLDWGRHGFDEVPVPRPGAGEVLVRVGAVGLCHSDLHFMDAPAGALPYAVPFTLGHEIAGWVAEVGPGVIGLDDGDAVLATAHNACGRCWCCTRGHDNCCTAGGTGRGFGQDGGLAPFVVVPQRQLVALGSFDPTLAAPLSDAGVTSYHAVKRSLPRLEPGTSAVVIGVGGLGGYAVQYLHLLSPAQVIAVDVDPARLEIARALGADVTMVSGNETVAAVRDLTGGEGAAAVFDFVGTSATMPIALACSRTLGSVALVGAGGGTAPMAWGAVGLECDVYIPMGAPISELREVVTLAAQGRLHIDVERFSFEQTAAAYRRFHGGDLRGRAVVTPIG